MLPVVRTAHDFRRACQEARLDGPLALVPTMGYLHEGHASLIRAARQAAPTVAVTIFVNPAQFGPTEDLARYPRDLEGDLRKAEAAGASFVFAPAGPEEMYPSGFQSYVEPGPLAQPLCGARRPGHFRGVCTVVAKLFALSRADTAFFGEKDFQQLLVIRRMAQDLNLGTDVVGRPIVREKDGRALSEARARFGAGERDVAALESLAAEVLDRHGLRADYAELRDPIELQRPVQADESTRLLLAAFVGKTRLIDNGALREGG